MNFFLQHTYLIGLIAFLLGAALMPIVIRIAKKKDFVVRPNKRMCHTGAIPNIGGLDICISFLLTYLIFEFNTLQQSQFLLIGVFAIMIVGFIDDILILSPLSKLICELLAGIALIGFADIRLTHLHGFLGIYEMNPIASYLLSFFVLASIINAINLIDGVDGLASGLGMLYCAFFATYFHLVSDTAWSILGICLVGALAVFFCYNVFGGSRNKIFMGDSGSLLLGYMLTAFVFHFCEINAYHSVPEKFQINAAPAVAICILSIPIFDTIRVMITRIKNHKSPFQPDKNHIHHLLLRTGLNHIQTTCVLLSVSILMIGMGILGRNWNILLLVCINFLTCSILTVILWRIIDHKNAQH
ncbi:MAG: undecaprenyl/decaprenyl-phosphate alpha-N-acetylglucosaminyl 1-phosphate transferase [Paludibacteraceae bacterium]|nr:undecaprenyl/decaprenyl-phosphate alpha-N-acetylglucosaminyl 1-phosphate transferase [Paludibacteraceae bacterium]